MSRQWSKAYSLTAADVLKSLSEKAGVYRIRVIDANGNPVPFGRVAGTDREGILHIGETVNLKDRLSLFRRLVEFDKEGKHHAAREFVKWRFKRLFPAKRLVFDYALTDTKADALKMERELHAEYRTMFLDRPPLDGTSGQGYDL